MWTMAKMHNTTMEIARTNTGYITVTIYDEKERELAKLKMSRAQAVDFAETILGMAGEVEE